ncbi:NUDIX domain-containing protein [Exiguobacterium sp. RIT594]|uniref:NUDIX hydrolase n=1 Tax=Exiguobacterium sp. RIT594 TaxID=2282449 RepID=UPI000DF7AA2A|nr:NUDIX domain-containing protein [Exiguobacterium sp. RIT594]RDB34628.1 NUDIX domain-containing protein [Exiguobacterium sp. RIT594]
MSESEQLMVVDSSGQPLYPETRETVHRDGLWHETFHCFVIDLDKGHVLLQQRAKQKKDFPELIDITAAGHLLAGEAPRDGIRELKEEIGLVRQFEELFSLGVFLEELIVGDLKDRERVHLFLTDSAMPLERYVLQTEEVSRLIALPLSEFARLTDETAETFKTVDQEIIHRDQFVPHPSAYFRRVNDGIQAYRVQQT